MSTQSHYTELNCTLWFTKPLHHHNALVAYLKLGPPIHPTRLILLPLFSGLTRWSEVDGKIIAVPRGGPLVIVTESPSSEKRKKKIFDFIDDLLQKTGKIGDYDQKI